MKAHRGNKSLMSILLNTLLLYPDHPYDFDQIWARAFDPQTKEYVKFLVTEPENLTTGGSVREGARADRRRQGGIAAGTALPGLRDLHGRERCHAAHWRAVLRQEGIRVGSAALLGCRPISERIGTSGS